ncbi:MAG: GNAT family N-acetyltransferase [Euryarchaeota archaeon]
MLSNTKEAFWRNGISPRKLDEASIERIRQLFFDQTGEEYARISIQTLPIPEWGGNLMLFDQNNFIRGLLWANRLPPNKIRIVAFVIDEDYISNGYGSKAWGLLVNSAREEGIREIQLEVKASNSNAINFYENRGLKIVQKLEGYYQSGLGYVMKGEI